MFSRADIKPIVVLVSWTMSELNFWSHHNLLYTLSFVRKRRKRLKSSVWLVLLSDTTIYLSGDMKKNDHLVDQVLPELQFCSRVAQLCKTAEVIPSTHCHRKGTNATASIKWDDTSILLDLSRCDDIELKKVYKSEWSCTRVVVTSWRRMIIIDQG